MKSFKADDSIDSPSSERKEMCKTIRSWELEILPRNLAFGKTLQYGERDYTSKIAKYIHENSRSFLYFDCLRRVCDCCCQHCQYPFSMNSRLILPEGGLGKSSYAPTPKESLCAG